MTVVHSLMVNHQLVPRLPHRKIVRSWQCWPPDLNKSLGGMGTFPFLVDFLWLFRCWAFPIVLGMSIFGINGIQIANQLVSYCWITLDSETIEWYLVMVHDWPSFTESWIIRQFTKEIYHTHILILFMSQFHIHNDLSYPFHIPWFLFLRDPVVNQH